MDDIRGFKINLHSDEADDAFISPESGMEKPKRPLKKSWMLILFFGMAAVLVVGGVYYHLNTKIQAINARGSAGIASLSEETNAKLLEFGALLFDQKKQLQQQGDELNVRLKKLDTSIAAIQTGKPDKKEMDAAIAQFTKDLNPLRQSINAWDEKLVKITEEIRLIAEALEKTRAEMSQTQKKISGLNEIYMDRAQFAQEMKNEREFNQQNMAHATETLFSEIASLNQRIKDLENKLDQLNSPTNPASGAKKKILESPPVKSLNNAKPEPGEIIEQEITQPAQTQP